MRVGDADVECDPGFKLYMVTRHDNPAYLPEASIMINLVNFNITRPVRVCVYVLEVWERWLLERSNLKSCPAVTCKDVTIGAC